MTRPEYISLNMSISRADGEALTPEQTQEVQGGLIDLMIEWCEARGYLMGGSVSPESGDGKDA